jgi:hypothetical protein
MLDFGFIRDNWLFIASGIGATLGVTIFSFLLAAPIAAIVGGGRRSTIIPIKAVFSLYTGLSLKKMSEPKIGQVHWRDDSSPHNPGSHR